MADKRVDELDDIDALADADSFPVRDASASTELKEVTASQIGTYIAAQTKADAAQAAAEATAAAALSAHVAAADPHTGYLTEAAAASTYQPLDADLTALAAANNGSVLAATTASFTTADETKLDGLPAAAAWPTVIGVACSDETTTLTTGTAKATFRMPHAMTLTAVRASLTTASSSGLVTVDINEGGTTILSTKLTVDANEKTSTTAATAPVISDTALADDAEMTVDIDGAGTGATGLKVWLIGTRSVA